ncbi:MAG TPA: hypothetical protein VKZ53_18965 [Candidatus Angelobacter sp.]|nr:hypothetical protein [Candidatus Angelobacter sp.]
MANRFENRVLGRIGARELTAEETGGVSGAGHIGTTTKCSFDPRTLHSDGDVGECA